MIDSIRVSPSLSFEHKIDPPYQGVLLTHWIKAIYQTRSFITVVTTGTLITYIEDLHYMLSDLLVARWGWKAS